MLFIGYGNVLEGRELGSWLFISCINSSLSHKSTTLGKYLVLNITCLVRNCLTT
jgi:hypothetical protein